MASGIGQNFLGKGGGGCQNLEIQGAPFVIRPPQKFRRGWDPRPSYAMIAKLRAACEARVESSRKLFCQEFTNVAENMVNTEGKPYHSTKCKLLDIIASTNTHNALQVPKLHLMACLLIYHTGQAAVIDLSWFTYAEFADHILKCIKRLATRSHVQRLDIVADTTKIQHQWQERKRRDSGVPGVGKNCLIFSLLFSVMMIIKLT